MLEGSRKTGYVLACDECGEEIDFSFFRQAVEYKRQNGWRSIKDSHGEWQDLCPDCAKRLKEKE